MNTLCVLKISGSARALVPSRAAGQMDRELWGRERNAKERLFFLQIDV